MLLISIFRGIIKQWVELCVSTVYETKSTLPSHAGHQCCLSTSNEFDHVATVQHKNPPIARCHTTEKCREKNVYDLLIMMTQHHTFYVPKYHINVHKHISS